MSADAGTSSGVGRRVLIWAIGVAVWAAALAGAFVADEWGYRVISRAVAAGVGYRPDRFGLGGGEGSGSAVQLLRLLKEMGQFFFILIISVTMIVLDRRRVRQVIVLWACIALAAVIAQALMRPGIAKLRADAELRSGEFAYLLVHHGEDPMVVRQSGKLRRFLEPVDMDLKTFVAAHDGDWGKDVFPAMSFDPKNQPPELRNVGKPLFRRPFSGMSGLTFPSGHTALAFAAFAALAAFFPRGRWWFLILACLVGLSRMLMGEHFLSDVIAGAGVGYASGALLLAIPAIRRFGEDLSRCLQMPSERSAERDAGDGAEPPTSADP